MRVLQVISGLLLATLVSLSFIGCSSGGGDPQIDPGTAVINPSSKTIVYAPGQGSTPNYIYARFDSTNSADHPSLANVPLFSQVGGTWTLDFSDDSADFNTQTPGNYVGEYDATVYGLFPGQTAPVMIGYRTRVTLNIVISSGGGDGPPPPPVFP